jgi:predicted AlkP superfamily pyrophosphatase or phosphodiesterase
MLNAVSLNVINNSKFTQNFIKPRYDSYCFANLPATITSLFTGQKQDLALPHDVFGNLPNRYHKVIFFFIDAFGWNFYDRYASKYNFLKTILAHGMISKMTSQFPSTTAAHVTCIHTGLNVGQAGVYEWNYYEPLVDEMISPLLFSYAGDKISRDTLKRSSIPAADFFPQQTFYHTLQAHGVSSHIFQYQAYSSSTYSDIVFRGANVHPYRNLSDAFTQLAELVRTPTASPSYYFLYFDRIDRECHNHGPYARQSVEILNYFSSMMEQFLRNVRGKAPNTLFMMSADHGQVAVNPRTTYYLNQQIPEIVRYMKTNQRGHPLVPAGSPRDMFLHIKDECIDEVIGKLRQCLVGRAEVYTTQELLARNFFGLQAPSPTFLARVGNVVILPHKYETVWWYEEDRFEMHFQGHHGGLTPEEMEIPLLLLPL